jgi:DNA repair exonuclease SbcCD nuclease subunit
MTFRFIHSSDLHLGKRFGQFADDLPARLREARHAVIGKLAGHAHDHDTQTVLLAGDTFDTETPAPDVRRQALAEMAHHASIRWVILPGNHDSLQAAQLWSTLRAEAPGNVTLALDATPLDLASGVTLLPAPCTTRRPGRDLSEWMDSAATGDGTIRIGLAHGAVTSFSEESGGLDVIAPDRARRAGLSYLALGDWHGGVEIDPRTRYSGTPEPDRFKHDRPGEALLVSIESAAAVPDVRILETGTFFWRTLALDLLDGEDAVARVQSLLPEARTRRQALVTLVAGGRARLEARAARSFWMTRSSIPTTTVSRRCSMRSTVRRGSSRSSSFPAASVPSRNSAETCCRCRTGSLQLRAFNCTRIGLRGSVNPCLDGAGRLPAR